MFIERRNILDLIGSDRRRYHSCIITCYSFDFQFFEERVMRTLRIANIKNVNVFIDGQFLEQALEYTTGKEFRNYKTYGINPIYTTGVFHPKIMLLTGTRHGLLLIGSGNLTSSGLSTNDEVWAAFHLDSIESPNAVLFGKAWQYLQSFFDQVRGFNNQKIEWIRLHSPWINQVAELGTTGFHKISNQMEVAFLADRPSQSIYRQLLDLLPAGPLSELTVISPYYDQQGKLLSSLASELQPEQFRSIIDTEYGLLPTEMTEEKAREIQFVDWQDCVREFDYQYNRLHAKILHFKYSGEEYLLLGSPNATIQAFGSAASDAVNHEAAVLLRRSGKINYLTDLGITIPDGKSISITAQPAGRQHPNERGDVFKATVKIVYAEIDGVALSFFVNKTHEEAAILVVKNEFDEEVERYELPNVNLETMEIPLSEANAAFKIHLENPTGQRISNFMLIHQAALQAKCNPDPNLQKLDELMDRIYDQTDEVSKLLDHIDYNWIDDEEENKALPYRSGGGGMKSETSVEKEVDFEVLDEADFNKIDTSRLFHQKELVNNASVRIAEFLASLKSGFAKSQEESFADDEEQALLEVTDRSGEGGSVQQEAAINTSGESEDKAIKRFLRKLDSTYRENLKHFYKSKQLYDVTKSPLTLRALSNLLIGFEILDLFYGKIYQTNHNVFSIITQREHLKEIDAFEKKFKLNRLKRTHPDLLHIVYYSVRANFLEKLTEEGKKAEGIHFYGEPSKEPLIKDHPHIEAGRTGDDSTTVKGFLNRILGQFLILSTGGIKHYEYDVINQKVRTNRERIFEAAAFFILNLHWSFREEISKQILLLDLLHYINPREWTDAEIKKFRERFNMRKESAGVINDALEENEAFFFGQLIPAYRQWVQALKNPEKRNSLQEKLTNLGEKNIVYDRKIGFCELIAWRNQTITLAKPGFPFDRKINSGVVKNILYPKDTITVWPK